MHVRAGCARNAVQAADGSACVRQMIKWKQEGMHLPNFGMDLSNPDFVKLAESMGACGHLVSPVCKSCFGVQGSVSRRSEHRVVWAPCIEYT